MIISKRTQLGLLYHDMPYLQYFLEDMKIMKSEEQRVKEMQQTFASLGEKMTTLDLLNGEVLDIPEDLPAITDAEFLMNKMNDKIRLSAWGTNKAAIHSKDKNADKDYTYLIMKGIEDCSKMIRIGDLFSTTAFKNVKLGNHLYLMGKYEFVRFACQKDLIIGVYWNSQNRVAFEFGFDMEDDKYFAPIHRMKEFNRIAKIITFIELGDIETIYLPAGKNNGKTKKAGKIANTTEFNVYVVDSSWNKLIIRTEGFGVHGHFRLQACGKEHKERKLIWIDSFEKKGYIRRPKAAIRE